MTDNTVHFDRSAGKKRALNILEQSGSETDNDGSTFIEYDNQEKKKGDEEIPPYIYASKTQQYCCARCCHESSRGSGPLLSM